jgi:predicted AAA+ superfamily ATPase
VFFKNTILEVLKTPPVAGVLEPEVRRTVLRDLPPLGGRALVLKGVRRCGKSTLQNQLRRTGRPAIQCNFEDPRLYGLGPADFPAFLEAIGEAAPASAPVFFDEVQEVAGWEKLVRGLLDRGRRVCVTGSNASLLTREVGAKLTGRHHSVEVQPFNYPEYLAFTGRRPGAESLLEFLKEGGFPARIHGRDPQILRELFRDIIERDIARRHGIRETRHLMNLALFLLANPGQPMSMQSLTKRLAIPSVNQTSRHLEHLADSYLVLPLQKHHASFKQRVVTPAKYYPIDNGLKLANSPQSTSDLGRRLETQVFLELRARGEPFAYDGEKDLWECDFVTADQAIQVCAELTPENTAREIGGLVRACKNTRRKATLVTLDQKRKTIEQGVPIEILPAWKWLMESGKK